MIASARKIKVLRFFFKLLRTILDFFIKIIFRLKEKKYSVIISEAFYSPWLIDEDFKFYLSKIKEFTMLDSVRLYTLWSLIKNIKDKNGIIIEIGTWRGGSSMLIAHRLINLKMNNIFYAFDTFEGVVKSTNKDDYYNDTEHSDCNYDDVKKQIQNQNLNNLKLIKGIFPDSLPSYGELHDQKFLFAHIDVDTYKSAKDILEFLWEKMTKSGIIIFDDYGFHQTNGIRECLDEFVSMKNDCYSHYLTTGQFLLIKV